MSGYFVPVTAKQQALDAERRINWILVLAIALVLALLGHEVGRVAHDVSTRIERVFAINN